ncbi:hypothetical protein [Nocardioides euryhalodurans]|uniref:Uncharacterized protein n=1 Tax=Nocardioides euryhalodurans TaxID=2518370 RepID=A0A4V1BDY3_9ACTN|nr:hypothetical protein [Nocardioides euryhalodurans]QBR92722.1 hypothetical protein EXE57_10870 [Nocardioides euryhalodurans]
MNGETRSSRSVRAGAVVAAVTLLAFAVPAVAPLYAQVYPPPDADTIDEALDEANLDARFASDDVTQFETVPFTATLIYGTATNPQLPTVQVSWSNEATLTAQDEDAFVILPTSPSRKFLSQGTRRPGGGLAVDWTWDVTPLLPGEQTLVVGIHPSVVVEGKQVPELADVNQPVEVTVDVNPVQRDFDDVVVAANDMDTELPDEMTVGEEHDVSATMSLAGHAGTVAADISLTQGETSADVTITGSSAAPQAMTPVGAVAADDVVERRWTVIPDEPGQVDLVFTAAVAGRAGDRALQQDVPIVATVRAVEPGDSFWEALQRPVLYLAPFAALAATLVGLWAAWSKRKQAHATAGPAAGDEGTGPPPPADPAP